MNCNQAIDYIHSFEKFGIKPGLERISALCELLGNPQNDLKFIHVAGTNGKGSTSTMLSNIFISSGCNVGLFTSPYVVDFRERIMFNGRMIEEDELAATVEKIKFAVDKLNKKGIEPTEFEVITAASFLYFKEKKCDLVVLEVGLGGRFDSTNIISTPLVSVIASISVDHSAILGDTVEKIAVEKCGIIKQGGVTVCYPEQKNSVLDVISKTCLERENKLIVPDLSLLSDISEAYDGTRAQYCNLSLYLPLSGAHMLKNCTVAVEAAKAVSEQGFKVSDNDIIKGVSASSMPARLEILRKKPLIILDGGHNEGCANALCDHVKKHLGGKRIVAVSSMMADKDYKTYLRIVAPLAETFIATKADVPRALSAEELADAAKPYVQNTLAFDNPVEAVKRGFEHCSDDDLLLVCGSFYLAGEVRDEILNF